MSCATRYKLTLAYDGSSYAGYQMQTNGPTVQGDLERALALINQTPVTVFGSSRTDAGVHAHGFVAHVDLTVPIPPLGLLRGLNTRLPPAIRILKVQRVSNAFDARKSALGKEYRYRIYQGEILPPELAPFWVSSFRPLNVSAMQEAAQHFVGTHDFVSFAANPHRELESTVRTIFSFTVKHTGPRLVCAVQGTGFLYKQVRSMVGFLLSVGKGNETPEAVTELLEAHAPRTARVQTAPPQGLTLWKVWYPK